MHDRIYFVLRVGRNAIIGAVLITIILLLSKLLGWIHLSYWLALCPIWFLLSFAFIVAILSLSGLAFISLLVFLFNRNR